MSNEELVKLIQHGRDMTENMEKLYIQNKGLIFAVIKRYRYIYQADYNGTPIIELDELMNEAYFGLVKAVESYNASQGVLFMTYATPWLRQAVKRYLDNCGQVIRVSVHTQQKIYKYNQVTAYYLQKLNRNPNLSEYAMWLEVDEKEIKQLQYYMFQSKMYSLDFILSGSDNEDTTTVDSITCNVDIESDVIEKMSHIQLKKELWDLVRMVLKDDKMIRVIRYRFVDKLTREEIGVTMGMSGELVRKYENKALKRLKCNSKTKRLLSYL